MAAIENHTKTQDLPGGATRPGDRAPVRLARKFLAAVMENLARESGRWFLWVPVFLGIGIGIYFSLTFEPPLFIVLIFFSLAAGLAALPRKSSGVFPLAISLLLVASGVLVAKLRSEYVAAPVLEKRLGPVSVTGLVLNVTGKAAGGQRLLIRPLHIDRLVESVLPARIQLTARMAVEGVESGNKVRFRAILMPPPGAARPGGFSYARMAWFRQIGATGFLVSAPRVMPAPENGIISRMSTGLQQLRAAVTKRILKGSGAASGGIAAALITGEKGALIPELRAKMRDAGLAHLLAISGLHMALFGGALFAFCRALFALSARLSLKYPIKKWSAFIALAGAGVYLFLSGGSIATQRAFIMISIMFLAIILDRRALSMRNVALAAIVILLLRPESLFNVSFQMSFAAVIALIAVYESGLFRLPLAGQNHSKLAVFGRIFILYILGNILTSVVAGAATGPFAAYHFHRFAVYGVLGNIAAVPVMALLIMPAALVSLVLMPFGLEAVPLAVMGFGIEIIIMVAGEVAALPGAARLVPVLHALALPLLLAGGLWLCLWRRFWRLAGVIPVLAGLAIAPFGARADIYIARDGGNLAVRDETGRLIVLKARKDAYSVRKWLEADGDRRSPRAAAADKDRLFSCDSLACIARLKNGKSLAYIRHPGALAEDCARTDIIIATIPVRRKMCKYPAQLIDILALKENGAMTITLKGNEVFVRTAAAGEGKRPWSSIHKRRGGRTARNK